MTRMFLEVEAYGLAWSNCLAMAMQSKVSSDSYTLLKRNHFILHLFTDATPARENEERSTSATRATENEEKNEDKGSDEGTETESEGESSLEEQQKHSRASSGVSEGTKRPHSTISSSGASLQKAQKVQSSVSSWFVE
jgi:hypothetical protein